MSFFAKLAIFEKSFICAERQTDTQTDRQTDGQIERDGERKRESVGWTERQENQDRKERWL